MSFPEIHSINTGACPIPEDQMLSNNNWRICISEKKSRSATAIGGHHPDIISKNIQNATVIEPLNLIINTARFSKGSFGTCTQIDDIEMPARFC